MRAGVTQCRVTESSRVAISTRVAEHSRLSVWLRIAGLRAQHKCSRALRILQRVTQSTRRIARYTRIT